jgi:hypothetical protein
MRRQILATMFGLFSLSMIGCTDVPVASVEHPQLTAADARVIPASVLRDQLDSLRKTRETLVDGDEVKQIDLLIERVKSELAESIHAESKEMLEVKATRVSDPRDEYVR